MLSAIVNGLLFNLSWLAIVKAPTPMLAPAVAALHLLVHFLIMGKGKAELKFIALIAVMGLAVDQSLFVSKILIMEDATSGPPLWLGCLWPVLATTMMHAFAGLQDRLYLAALVGGIGGGVTYFAGTQLSNVAFGSMPWGPLLLAGIWALLFPSMLRLAQVASRDSGASR